MKLKLDLSLTRITARRGSLFQKITDALAPRAVVRGGLSLLLCAGLTGFSTPAEAGAVTGTVKLEDGRHYLQPSGSREWYEMRPATEEARQNLDRLQSQDYYQGQGEFFGATLLVQTVDFVGLYSLLGPWRSKQDRALVTFENYNTLSIFNPRTLGYDRVAMFAYSVAPDSGSRWKIFVSGAQSVSIASLKIEEDRLVLQFINLDTGAFEKPVELVRKSP